MTFSVPRRHVNLPCSSLPLFRGGGSVLVRRDCLCIPASNKADPGFMCFGILYHIDTAKKKKEKKIHSLSNEKSGYFPFCSVFPYILTHISYTSLHFTYLTATQSK
jgi:hypothetical protein